jgi:hypothetical protein
MSVDLRGIQPLIELVCHPEARAFCGAKNLCNTPAAPALRVVPFLRPETRGPQDDKASALLREPTKEKSRDQKMVPASVGWLPG